MNFITAKELADAILRLPEAEQNKPIVWPESVRFHGILKSSTHLPSFLETKLVDPQGFVVYPSSCYSAEQREQFMGVIVLGERNELLKQS